MLNVQKLHYSSTCAHCEKGVEGGEGIRLLRTLSTGRTGLDFHRECLSLVVRKAAGLFAPELIEINGVYYFPEESQDVDTRPAPHQQAKKVIPKRRS